MEQWSDMMLIRGWPKCPLCNRYLNYNMNTGGIYYTCICGYDTRDQRIVYDNHTTIMTNPYQNNTQNTAVPETAQTTNTTIQTR